MLESAEVAWNDKGEESCEKECNNDACSVFCRQILMYRLLFLRAIVVNKFGYKSVKANAEERCDHPDHPLIQIVDLHGWEHEYVPEGDHGPQSTPHLILDKAPIQLDQCEESSKEKQHLTDERVVRVQTNANQLTV